MLFYVYSFLFASMSSEWRIAFGWCDPGAGVKTCNVLLSAVDRRDRLPARNKAVGDSAGCHAVIGRLEYKYGGGSIFAWRWFSPHFITSNYPLCCFFIFILFCCCCCLQANDWFPFLLSADEGFLCVRSVSRRVRYPQTISSVTKKSPLIARCQSPNDFQDLNAVLAL